MSKGRRMRHSARANQCLMYSIYVNISMAKRRGAGRRTLGILRSPNLFQRSSIVYKPIKAVTKNPTHLTLTTQPMLMPVNASHTHQSRENGLKE